MNDSRQWIPLGGLIGIVAVAGYMVVQLNAQAPAAFDYSNASVAEVRDASGTVILSGVFAESPEEDDDLERKALLEPNGVDPDALGQAEVEIDQRSSASQEVEVSIRNVQPNATYTFIIDGREVTRMKANARGRAEVELKSPAERSAR